MTCGKMSVNQNIFYVEETMVPGNQVNVQHRNFFMSF